jgi:hypothetical protein
MCVQEKLFCLDKLFRDLLAKYNEKNSVKKILAIKCEHACTDQHLLPPMLISDLLDLGDCAKKQTIQTLINRACSATN